MTDTRFFQVGEHSAIARLLLAFLGTGMARATNCLKRNPLDEAARLRLVLAVTLLVSTQFNPSGTSIYWLIVGMMLANSCAGTPRAGPAAASAP